MKHTYTHSPTEVTPRSAVDAAGINVTSEPGWTLSGATLEFDLPGVESVTDEQQLILDIFAEYRLTGRERYPGIIAALTATRDLKQAQAALMGAMIDATATGNPTSGLILLVAQMVNDAINEFRDPVPFDQVVAQAKARLSTK